MNFYNRMYTRHLYISILDLGSIVVFSLSALYFYKHARTDHHEAQRQFALPSQFTIFVKNINENTTEKEIEEFFKNFGGTYDIKIARNYKDTLFLHKQQVAVLEQIKVLELNLKYDEKEAEQKELG